MLVDRYVEEVKIPSVITNNFKGGMLAANYLSSINNIKIGIITFGIRAV